MRATVSRMTLALLTAALLGVLAVSGCSSGSEVGSDATPGSAEATPGAFPKDKPSAPEVPPPPMLRKPEQSVYSYLTWISYAYRILDSDVASMAFSPFEEVRVNSYVELNRQQKRAIDQRLVGFEVKSAESKGSTATVAARETWRYRYIDISTGKYNGAVNEVTYDTTYTVVSYPDKGWLVDSVKATAVGTPPK